MKIIEALKELPVIEKRIEKQASQIAEYAGLVSNEQPPFGTSDAQKKKVSELIQSNYDLSKRYAKLKRALAITNTQVEVEVLGEKRTIAEWITFKTHTANQLARTLNALNLSHAQARLQTSKFDVTEGIKIERMYDEEFKLKQSNRVQELLDNIDATLEIVNATTDLTVEV
jgi:hypothetical protein